MKRGKDYFVIVTEHDTDMSKFPLHPHEPMGPIVMETYLRSATSSEAISRKKQLGNKYGRCSIAKLVFLTNEEIQQLTEE